MSFPSQGQKKAGNRLFTKDRTAMTDVAMSASVTSVVAPY